MLLAIDIGNSNIVFGLSENDQWVEVWRIHTVFNKTSDEYEVIFRTLFSSRKVNLKKVNKIVLSSVVPSLNCSITKMIIKLFDKKPVLVGPGIYPKLKIKITNPYEIGSDLVANAVAVNHKYTGNCIIIDMGTALTLTAINANGKIMGVSIAPGLKTAMNSLSGNTAQLPNVEIEPPPSALGRNTVHAIQSGVVLGYKGLIETLVSKIKQELKGKTNVIATGGLSIKMTHLLNCITHTEKNLTLDGLRLIGNSV